MPFWNFLGFVLAPCMAIGEGVIYKVDAPSWAHGILITGFVIGAWIKFNIKDDNNNGIADNFEKK